MRVETGLSIVILTTWLLTHWKIDRIAVAAIFILSINTFVLFRISESRQSIATVLLSIFYFVALGGIRAKKLLYVMTVGLIASFPLIYFLAGDYISKFLSSSNYIADGNVEIRLDALDFYLDRFWDTGGLGFGVLSNGDDATNFFATSARVGNGSWQYLIADIGIFSPLVQFGWIGLFVVVFLTLRLAYMFITTARRMGRSESVLPFAFGCFLLGSMLHPWPMNYFTLEWTIMFGSLTWFTCNDLLARYPRKSPTAILPAQSRSLATA